MFTHRPTPAELSQRRWLPSTRDLSPEQLHIINDSFDGYSFVYGPAGAGKTALIAWRAWNLQKRGKQFMIFVYTNELFNFIQAATSELGVPDDRIQSFYSWVWRQYKDIFGSPPERQFDKWVDELITFFEAHPERTPRYEYVLIDEAQDFKPNVARLIHMTSKNIFVLGDGAQSLYTDVAGVQQLMDIWSPVDRRAYLTKNFRNPKTVARVAAHFLTDAALTPDTFLQMVPGHRSEMKPVWYQVESADKQTEIIASLIGQARGQQRIGILFAEREQVLTVARQLRSRGIACQVAENKRGTEYFNTTLPILMTINSAKGLEFDWVILPDLNRTVWDKAADRASKRRLFFVAITRTKSRLYLISRQGMECRYLREIPTDLLQIPQQQGRAPQAVASAATSKPAAVELDDDLPF